MAQRVKFDKIVPEGKALAHWHDKALFAVGPLPGETAEVRITCEKRHWAEAAVRQLVETSPHRGEPHETHYLSCSPWQAVDYDYQCRLKIDLLTEVFNHPDLQLPVAQFVGAPQPFGYRNKLEFTLMPAEDGQLQLSFHARGSYLDLVPAPHGCVLGMAGMNAAARAVLARLNQLEVADAADTLTVRQSFANGRVLAVLLVKEPVERHWASLLGPELAGLAVVRKLRHDQFEVLWQHGDLELTETLAGTHLVYPWDSFFQVNVPMFEQALQRILAYIQPDSTVVDLYGGAGTIGLPAARVASKVTGVEIVASSVELANHNAQLNQLKNYEAIVTPSEKLEAHLLAAADTVIVDPPRAGLHPKVVQMLLEAAPKQIVYLSCNPVTQARDVRLLKAAYDLSPVTGFDFYPGTLHLESLVVLTKRT